MALNAYLRLKGEKQGEIKGSVTQRGREGRIMVFSASHSIESPRDAASGLPTGKRQHEPFVIKKELDRSTPLLYSLLVNNEKIVEWELQFWEPGPTDNKDLNLMKRAEYEEIAFTYEKIQWIWNDGGITSSDDWLSPA